MFKADKLATLVPIVCKSWEPQSSGALGAYLGLYRESFTFTFLTTPNLKRA